MLRHSVTIPCHGDVVRVDSKSVFRYDRYSKLARIYQRKTRTYKRDERSLGGRVMASCTPALASWATLDGWVGRWCSVNQSARRVVVGSDDDQTGLHLRAKRGRKRRSYIAFPTSFKRCDMIRFAVIKSTTTYTTRQLIYTRSKYNCGVNNVVSVVITTTGHEAASTHSHQIFSHTKFIALSSSQFRIPSQQSCCATNQRRQKAPLTASRTRLT